MSAPNALTSSPLVRLLDGWAGAPGADPGGDLAERWSQWLGPLDAVRLQAAQQSIRAMPVERAAPAPAAARALADELQKLQASLSATLQQAQPAETGETGFAPYRRRHTELQRLMATAIAPLRARLRQGLARAAGPLRQLAVLDALLEQQLDAHEHKLLATVPAHLEQRFKQLHTQASEEADQPAPRFGQDWRAALLAELDLRLQPLHGLLEALKNEHPAKP